MQLLTYVANNVDCYVSAIYLCSVKKQKHKNLSVVELSAHLCDNGVKGSGDEYNDMSLF